MDPRSNSFVLQEKPGMHKVRFLAEQGQPRQHIKNRGVTLPTKVSLVKVMVFPVAMYACESRTIKKAEH